jgi:carboxyl-terminal processing protease
VDDFAEHTDEDLGKALDRMTEKGMKRLVLDLRGHPGGQLDQAIRITNRFVPKGSMIVYTRGRVANSDQDYRATDNGDYLDLPIVVLVSRHSASASEIVSGALQDHDRAYVVGETTFGKALVQSVYRVSQGAGLALTTARYFTPSGRMIQRPWDTTFDEYVTYTLRDQNEAPRAHTPEQLKHTLAGRPVYSGGGIEPDKRFEGPIEGFNPTRFGRTLYARQLFASYAEQFTAEGDKRPGAQGKNRKVVNRTFAVDDARVEDFKQFAIGRKLTIDETSWTKDKEFIRAMIRYEIDYPLFSAEVAQQHLIEADPQAKFALTQFPEAQKLAELARARTTKVGQ